MNKRLMLKAAMAAVSSTSLMGAAAWSQANYPQRPVRLVVPMPPGGAADILGRYLAVKLGDALGQTVVVDNKPGAGANIGAEIVAKAAADGYTLLLAPSSIYAVSVSAYPQLGYSLEKDFSPVSVMVNVPHVLLVPASLPVHSVAEFIAYAKARPDSINLGSQGNGTVSHLEGELFARQAGLRFTHIPYKGSAPALLALVGGEVQVAFDSLAAAQGQIKAGTVRALAVTPSRRITALPALPTIAESGLPKFSAESYMGLFAPAGTPPAVVARLHREVERLVQGSDSRGKLIEFGFEPVSSTPDEYARAIGDEVRKWSDVVRQSGLVVN